MVRNEAVVVAFVASQSDVEDERDNLEHVVPDKRMGTVGIAWLGQDRFTARRRLLWNTAVRAAKRIQRSHVRKLAGALLCLVAALGAQQPARPQLPDSLLARIDADIDRVFDWRSKGAEREAGCRQLAILATPAVDRLVAR